MAHVCAECIYYDPNNKKTSSRDERRCTNIGKYVAPTDRSCKYFKERVNPQSGCFITTVVVDILGYEDDCWILNSLRQFRNEVMQNNPFYFDMLKEYDTIGPIIAEKLRTLPNQKELSILVAQYYLIPICRFINDKDYLNAINLYQGMVRFLQNQVSVLEVASEYVYDDSVLPEEMGHGRARVIPINS